MLSALSGDLSVKALLIPLCLLNRPHKVALFRLADFDIMLPGDFFDLVDFHGGDSFVSDVVEQMYAP
jgi:hypothetical protein